MNIILIRENETFFPLSDERAEHILRVLHLKEGDSFKAGIINAKEGRAKIISIKDDKIAFSFLPEKDSSSLYPVDLIVGQTRPICMRRILREACSLGVRRIFLPITDLGEKSYLSSSLYKDGEYEKIVLDGAMQSGFTGVSECHIMPSINEAIKAVEDCSFKLLFDNQIGTESLSKIDLRGSSVALAIGPERGWSNREREIFITMGFKPTLIGRRILRTETAVPSSVTLTLSRMGLI